MKILLAASDNYKFSGAFKSMARLAKHLKEDFGNEVRILLPYYGNGEDLLESENLSYDVIKSYDWVFSKKIKSKYRYKNLIKYCCNVFNANKIKKYLLTFKPDIVHINTSWCYLVGKMAENLGIPVIWHIREFLDEDQNMTYINKRKAIRTYSKAKSVVCISKAIQGKYINYKLKNTKLIYNGIDGATFEKDKNHDILSNNFINFIMIGGICENKGQLWIIESFIKLIEDKIISPNDFCLHLVGSCDKNYVKNIKDQIRNLHLNQCFDFTGPKNNVEEMLSQCDCFLMNSKCEAFGRVTVEAMMAGCLAIGCDTGCTPEIIESNVSGILYQYRDYSDFKNNISSLLSDKSKFKQIAKQGQVIAFSKFDSFTNAKQINDLYIDTIEQEEQLKRGGRNDLITLIISSYLIRNASQKGAF